MHAFISLLSYTHLLLFILPPPLSMYVFLSLLPFTHSLYVIPPDIYFSLSSASCLPSPFCMYAFISLHLFTHFFVSHSHPASVYMYVFFSLLPFTHSLSLSFSSGMPISFYSPFTQALFVKRLYVCIYHFTLLFNFLRLHSFFSLIPPLPNYLSIKDKHIIHNAVPVK